MRKKDNLAQAEIFARIYAFYNHQQTNNNRFQISSKSGGSGRIVLNNTTNWNIEIRRDGPTGEVLGFVAPQMLNIAMHVNAPDDYTLFLVFKRFVQADNEIYQVVPKFQSGTLEGKPFSRDFGLESADSTVTWNLAEVADKNLLVISSGSFYINIINNSGTAVRFTRGADPQTTSTGILSVNPATNRKFAVGIARNFDGTYPESQSVGQLRIGATANPILIPTQVFKLDYVYTIEVTGTDASNLVLGDLVESDNPLDLEAIFGF
jgi:hypothetical protein